MTAIVKTSLVVPGLLIWTSHGVFTKQYGPEAIADGPG
jgi:hypothetical protein